MYKIVLRKIIKGLFYGCASVLLIGYFISGGIPDGVGFGVGAIYFLVEMVFGIILWEILSISYMRQGLLNVN